jgi:hypothetical protein
MKKEREFWEHISPPRRSISGKTLEMESMMDRKKMNLIIIFLVIGISMSACNLGASNDQNGNQAIYTQAAQTLEVELTEMAESYTATPVVPTPTATLISPTATEIPPTNTPLPTNTPPPTPIPTPCDWVKFISDVTVADGTVYKYGTKFEKTWRLKNIGVCTWTREYDLVFVDGYKMGGSASVSLPADVQPGETVDVSVSLTTPIAYGNYTGHWMLRNNHGVLFGIGASAESTFWVKIKAVEPGSDFFEDLATNYCVASWYSSSGKVPCPSKVNKNDGFVILLDNPELENRLENEPTLWVRPDDEVGGWIEGVYPPIKVKKGDRFRAWVGCLDLSDKCDVTFQLNYSINGGPIRTIMQWREVYDGAVSMVDVMLTDLADKEVQFILTVISNSKVSADQNAFWFVPRIVNKPDQTHGVD